MQISDKRYLRGYRSFNLYCHFFSVFVKSKDHFEKESYLSHSNFAHSVFCFFAFFERSSGSILSQFICYNILYYCSYFHPDVFRRNEIETEFILKIKILVRAVFIAMTFEIILVLKHYSQYYLIPAFMLSTFALFVSANYIYHCYYKGTDKKLSLNSVYKILIILIFLYSSKRIVDLIMKEVFKEKKQLQL